MLEVARSAFAAEGLSVPIDVIAARAGVGAGTVYRHFPTKDLLFEAIVVDLIEHLASEGRALRLSPDPGGAFFGFFTHVVDEAVRNRALVDAITGAGIDLEASTQPVHREFDRAIGDLLRRAQSAGTVRDDIRAADVKALIVGCLTMAGSSERSRRRVMSVICDGLRG